MTVNSDLFMTDSKNSGPIELKIELDTFQTIYDRLKNKFRTFGVSNQIRERS